MTPRHAALSLAVLWLIPAHALTWKTCGTGPMTPSSVTLSPDPAVAGRLIAVTVPGVTSAPVASGKISVLVSYTGVPVYETSVNLCDTVDCPVAPGEVTVRYNTTLPGVAPPGPYGIKFAGADSDSGSTLFCVDLAFSIVPAPHGLLLGKTLMPGLGGVLGGAVLRDGLAELRAAFEAAASGQEEPQWAAALL